MRSATRSAHDHTMYDVDPSMEPTSRPVPARAFGMGALATFAGLRDSHGNVPLDLCVPIRTGLPAPPVLDLGPSLVLFCVDGVSSLRTIAGSVGMDLTETIEAFYELVAFGLVEVEGDAAPGSGTYPRVEL